MRLGSPSAQTDFAEEPAASRARTGNAPSLDGRRQSGGATIIRLTWRQHRGEAFVALVGLGVLAAFLLIIGVSINATYQQFGVGKRLGIAAAPNCVDVVNAVRQETGFWRGFTLWLTLVPMVLAMLVGAPLVAREFEQGTFRLVWTQSAPRMRWLHGKLALIISASLALTLFTEIETAIFVGLAIALVTLTIYWVRRLPG